MNLAIQEQLPAWYFARHGRPPHKADIDRATDWVHRALQLTRRSVEREFEGRGYAVELGDLSWPQAFGAKVRLRAKLDMRGKRLILDSRAEADLHYELEMLGFPTTPAPRTVLLAHELFHLFCSKCPASLAEMAAHLYAAELLELPYFPGILDVSHRFERPAALISA